MGNAELCRVEEPWAPQSPDENGKRKREGEGKGEVVSGEHKYLHTARFIPQPS